jgi:hypothetical protein
MRKKRMKHCEVPEEEDATQFATSNFGPYITLYIPQGGNNLDREYGMRRNTNGKFRVGNSEAEINEKSNNLIANKRFRETKGLFELITRKNIMRSEITSDDLKTYKSILELTCANFKIVNL